MVLPYEFMNSFERFDEINSPNKEDFYSVLNVTHICDKVYEHALNIENEVRVRLLSQSCNV